MVQEETLELQVLVVMQESAVVEQTLVVLVVPALQVALVQLRMLEDWLGIIQDQLKMEVMPQELYKQMEVHQAMVLLEVLEEHQLPLRLQQLLLVQLQLVALVVQERFRMPEDLSDKIILQGLLLEPLLMCMQQAQLLRLVLLVKMGQRVVLVEVLHSPPQEPEE